MVKAKTTSRSSPVLPFLAIFRQIRDFGPLFGDGNYELAMYRQSPNFRDFEPQKVAILANSSKTWRFWRNIEEIGKNPEKLDNFYWTSTRHQTEKRSHKITILKTKSKSLKPQKCNMFLEFFFQFITYFVWKILNIDFFKKI